MAERMCLVSYSKASGATEWNVTSVCESPLLVHVVTPPSQRVMKGSNTSPGSLKTALLGYQISQMECDLPSVKHKNSLIRIVRNSSNYFHIFGQLTLFCCSQSSNKQTNICYLLFWLIGLFLVPLYNWNLCLYLDFSSVIETVYTPSD